MGVEADDGGEEEAGLLGDELLAGGRGQLGLELQDLLLLDVGHLQLRRPHVLALPGVNDFRMTIGELSPIEDTKSKTLTF